MIEPQLAFLAAHEVTAAQLAELEGILETQRQMAGAAERFTAADYSFHLRIAIAAGSRVYLKLYTTLADMLNQTREEFLQEGERPQRSVTGHEAILAALRHRDAAQARAAMAKHLRTIEEEALRAREK
jgi:GntR family transcriptional repressor for pyruvate dehydrogenase complex